MVWLSADCDTPSFAAALVKLCSRADGEKSHKVIEMAALHLWILLISPCGL